LKSLRNNQLYRLIGCRFLETVREPEVLFWGIVFPVLISIGLGLAFMQKNETKFNIVLADSSLTAPDEGVLRARQQSVAWAESHAHALDSLLAVYGQTETKKGKQVITWTVTDETLGVTHFAFTRRTWADGIISLKRGEADLIITDSLANIHYHFDPRNAQAELAYLKLSDLLKAPSNVKMSQQELSPLTLKGVRYIDFFIPGLIAFGLMSSLLWGVSYTIIECRSQKLLRRMIATPMKKHNFLISIVFVRTTMNVLESLIVFFCVFLLFDIRIQGNIAALTILFIAGNIAFAGISVLLSCRTSKTEAGTGLINAVQMPMMLLSGIFFSYHNFPEWSIGAIKLLPLTALADGMRSIFNEGAGFAEVMTPVIALTALGVICFYAGIKMFKWQ